jgi:hypothetical protein
VALPGGGFKPVIPGYNVGASIFVEVGHGYPFREEVAGDPGFS